MNTRRDYLEGRCSHREYYLEIASGLHLKPNEELLQWVRQSKDEHLNDIPLRRWDALAASILVYNRASVAGALRDRGDFITDAGMVSLLKVFYLEEATKG